jgi:hypothetical protein
MGGAMKIKSNIDSLAASLNRLYSKLANMAFWDSADQAAAQPTPIDWNVAKKTITLDKTSLSSNSIITNGNDEEITDSTVQVDEGGSFTFKIKPKDGCVLTAASASVGGNTITPDSTTGGIYTFTIEDVTSNITIVLSSTAVSSYSINYNLSNCAAPSGVTNPLSIKDGETKTIYLETIGYYQEMPSSLPSGAVTGATAAYERDSQDRTKATITLSNASDNVSINLSAETLYSLVPQLATIVKTDNYWSISNAPTRGTVLMLRTTAGQDSCTWGSGTNNVNTTAVSTYTVIPIPSGATKVSMQCDASLSYGLSLVNSSGVNQNTVEWTTGSTKKVLNFADYPNATHVALNFKYAVDKNFSNETLESMGVEFVISKH